MPAIKSIQKTSRAVNRRSPLCEHYPNRSHAMGSGLVPVSCEALRQYIEKGSHSLVDTLFKKPLVLDCRPFLVHNDSHIVDAVNVHCPAILRRRTVGGLPLRTVIPDEAIRQQLLAGEFHPIVLYEDGVHIKSESSPDSMAIFVAKCIQQEAGLKTIHLLEGGFETFRHVFPHLCTKGLSAPIASGICSLSSCGRSPSCGNLTWPLKSSHKGSSTPRTPKNNNLCVDSGALLSFGSDQGEPVEILPYLYLGSEYHASCKPVLEKLGITSLLNVSQTCPNHFEDIFTYKSIPVEDSGHEDISIWFHEAIDFIETAKRLDGKVLVHCRAGISRSATICMAYLMATRKLRMEEAYEFVKSRRRIVSPNFNFMGQLLNFEAQVFSSGDSVASPSNTGATSDHSGESSSQLGADCGASPEGCSEASISNPHPRPPRNIFDFNQMPRECRSPRSELAALPGGLENASHHFDPSSNSPIKSQGSTPIMSPT